MHETFEHKPDFLVIFIIFNFDVSYKVLIKVSLGIVNKVIKIKILFFSTN